MKKSNLSNGAVVKFREGSLMMVLDEMLVGVDTNLSLNDYNDTLEHYTTTTYDIVALYIPAKQGKFTFSDLSRGNDTYLKLIWEREIKLTEDMKTLLRLLPEGKYKYLSRNNTRGGTIKVHQKYPDFINNATWQTSCFVNGEWTSDYERSIDLYSHIFDTLPKGICIKISDFI